MPELMAEEDSITRLGLNGVSRNVAWRNSEVVYIGIRQELFRTLLIAGGLFPHFKEFWTYILELMGIIFRRSGGDVQME